MKWCRIGALPAYSKKERPYLLLQNDIFVLDALSNFEIDLLATCIVFKISLSLTQDMLKRLRPGAYLNGPYVPWIPCHGYMRNGHERPSKRKFISTNTEHLAPRDSERHT